MGLMEGLVVPSFLQDHFQLNDFTPFHDEIRRWRRSSWWASTSRGAAARAVRAAAAPSLGSCIHVRARGQFGFYYTLTRVAEKHTAHQYRCCSRSSTCNCRTASGMTFDEEMAGWYFRGAVTPLPGRAAERTIAALVPASGRPANGVLVQLPRADDRRATSTNSSTATSTKRSVKGTIRFGELRGHGTATFAIDEQASRFQLSAREPGDRRSRDALPHRVRRAGRGAASPSTAASTCRRTGGGGASAIARNAAATTPRSTATCTSGCGGGADAKSGWRI